jgi:hypothetical protein
VIFRQLDFRLMVIILSLSQLAMGQPLHLSCLMLAGLDVGKLHE